MRSKYKEIIMKLSIYNLNKSEVSWCYIGFNSTVRIRTGISLTSVRRI